MRYYCYCYYYLFLSLRGLRLLLISGRSVLCRGEIMCLGDFGSAVRIFVYGNDSVGGYRLSCSYLLSVDYYVMCGKRFFLLPSL